MTAKPSDAEARRSAQSAERWRSVAVGAALLLVSGLGLYGAVAGHAPARSIDFYQFWAVPTARKLASGPLGTPYRETGAYRAQLEASFGRGADPELRAVHRRRMAASFEPFGSPLLYAGFALLPTDYGPSALAWRLAQIAAFCLGTFALARRSRLGATAAVAFVAAALFLYRPLGDDLLLGNLNSLQLVLLAAALTAASPPRPRPALALSVLVALALLKLNLALVLFASVLSFAGSLSARSLGRALAAAGAVGTLGIVVGCLYFERWGAWGEWFSFVFIERGMTGYGLAEGSTAPQRLLVDLLGVPSWLAIALLAAFLAGSAALALATPGIPARRRVLRALDDPGRAMGLGLVATFALSPLLWFHYLVLAVLPGLHLLGGARRVGRWLGGAALLLYAGFFAPLVWQRFGAEGSYALGALWSVTWLPLWIGLLLESRAAAQRSA